MTLNMFKNRPNQAQATAKQPAGNPLAQGAQASSHSEYDSCGIIACATPSQGNPKILSGNYPLLYLDVFKLIISRQGHHVYIAEFHVLESDVSERPPKCKCDCSWNMQHDISAGQILSFLSALMNQPADEITTDDVRFLITEENPAHGRLIKGFGTDIVTQKNKIEMVRMNWSSIPEEDQDNAELAYNEVFGE